MKEDELRQLLVRIQNDDDNAALERVYKEYFSRIYTYVFFEIRKKEDAYDIAMDIFLKICDYSKPYGEVQNPIGLIVTMAQNTVKDYYRRKKFCAEVDIETVHLEAEFRNRLWIADILQLLNEQEKNLFFDHLVWGKRLKDIAEERGLAYITIKRSYQNIKRKIKRLYQ